MENKKCFVRLCFCDTAGCRRGKLIPYKNYEKIKKQGLGLAKAIMANPSVKDHVIPETGLEADYEVVLIPDDTTFKNIPWRPQDFLVQVDMKEIDGSEFFSCPRTLLKNALKKFKEETGGYEVFIGFELEFQIFNADGKLADNSVYAQSRFLDKYASLFDDIILCLDQLKIGVELVHTESASGQLEVALTYGPAIESCDNLLITRDTINAIAMKHGFSASFLPKICEDEAGNGNHVHISFVKDEINCFYEGKAVKEQLLSQDGEHFLAGVLNHLESIMCLTTPSPNSFRRLVPGYWSGALKSWGIENRETPVRLTTKENFEIKLFDATANPYHGVTAIIACALDGLKNKLVLPEPVNGDPNDLSEEVKAERKVTMLPKTWDEAVKYLEKCKPIKEFFGEELFNNVMFLRKFENDFCKELSLEEEIKCLGDKY